MKTGIGKNTAFARSRTRRLRSSRLGGLLVAALSVAAGGCATAPKDAGFGGVSEAVARRSGDHAFWNEGPVESPVVAERVHRLLGGELTSDRAVEVALLENHGLQAALGELGVARADLLEAGLLRNPLFGGEVRFPGRPIQPYELTLVQSVLDIFERPMRRRVAAARLEQVKLQAANAVLELAAETRAAYYRAQAAGAVRDLRRTVQDAAGVAAELAERQYKAGNITALDLDNETAVSEEAQLDLARSERDLVLERERLALLMGVEACPADLATPLPLPAPEPELPDLEAVAVRERLDVSAARADVEAAAHAKPLARLQKLGELNLGIHQERDAEGQKTTGPAVEISLPVFNHGQAAVLGALARWRQSAERLAALEAQARSEVRVAHARLAASRTEAVHLRDVVVPRRRRIVEEVQLEYNAMSAGVFQLLEARRGELDAERQEIESERDYWVARTELERAVGGRLLVHAAGAPEGASGAKEGGGR
jgi:cobalt-zinc-cadmium efflux system outer membrane protein